MLGVRFVGTYSEREEILKAFQPQRDLGSPHSDPSPRDEKSKCKRASPSTPPLPPSPTPSGAEGPGDSLSDPFPPLPPPPELGSTGTTGAEPVLQPSFMNSSFHRLSPVHAQQRHWGRAWPRPTGQVEELPPDPRGDHCKAASSVPGLLGPPGL